MFVKKVKNDQDRNKATTPFLKSRSLLGIFCSHFGGRGEYHGRLA